MRAGQLNGVFLGASVFASLLLVTGEAWSAEKRSAWSGSAGQSQGHSNPRFRLELSQAATVQIDLESTTTDTYLYLMDVTGFIPLGSNDNFGTGTNSRLTMTLNAGTYHVIAATRWASQRGDFTLRTSHGALKYCFFAYEDAHYGGAAHQFCEGNTQPLLNDQYSSFRVPKGMRLKVFENGDLTGLGRTYYGDVPWLGDSYNDMISAFQATHFQVDDYFMIFASDPQFSWTHCQDSSSSGMCAKEMATYPGLSKDVLSSMYNVFQTFNISRLRGYLGDHRFGGLVVNGDLTEFGDQGSDLGNYISLYQRGLNMNVYPGLGNHDYENNVDDCAENGCASTMVRFLKDEVRTLNPVSFDYSESTYYEFPNSRKNHSGSLGYSWEIGDVHYVQLNNHPSYSRSWNGWNFSEARRDYFDIFASIAWLRNDLKGAVSRGKKIILNMHDYCAEIGGSCADTSNTAFGAILEDIPVSAVYAGHYHGQNGEYQKTSPHAGGRSVPVLLSGSAHHGTFLVARLVNGKMYVWVMDADQFAGGELRVKYDGVLHPAGNLDGIFDIHPGSTRYYQYVYDLH